MNCPLCNSETISKLSSAGTETYCPGCRNILASATLGFTMLAGGTEQCSLDGLPGYKGPGEKAKCYTYQPGNEAQEQRAKEKAEQSAYMEQREAHVAKLVEAIPSFTEAPSKILPDTFETEDGIEVGGLEDVGSGRTVLTHTFHPSISIEHEDLDSLGRGYCTSCGGNHVVGEPCI